MIAKQATDEFLQAMELCKEHGEAPLFSVGRGERAAILASHEAYTPYFVECPFINPGIIIPLNDTASLILAEVQRLRSMKQ